MAHKEQIEYCKKVRALLPDYFEGVMVLDAGSLDINGNNQYLFKNSHYIGIDVGEGKNVDFVQRIDELSFPDESFDTIISTEVFEHDMHYIKSIQNLYRMLKPGGLLLFTCATTGRPEHGTRRTTPDDAPFLQSDDEWSDYYKNLTEDDVRDVINVDDCFSSFRFEVELGHKDLNFWGVKNGVHNKRNDSSYHIETSIVNVDLDESLSCKVLEIGELESKIEKLATDNATINSKFIVSNDMVLKQSIKIDQLENELASVYLSRSWRVTRYFRKISSIFK